MKPHALSRLTRVVSAAMIFSTGHCLAEAPTAIAGAAAFDPGPCDGTFTDVPAESPFCAWIELIDADGVIEDCGGNNFCPDQPVTRAALAMFLERAMRGTEEWDVDADLLDGHDSTEFVQASALTWASSHRKFYVTFTGFTGLEALDACAPGYHMASLWEIHDVSQLSFVGLGASRSDAGEGPPSGIFAWVRTGVDSFPGATAAGNANCLAWQSDSANEKGTLVGLITVWDDYENDNGVSEGLNRIYPWTAITLTCDTAPAVWCVED